MLKPKQIYMVLLTILIAALTAIEMCPVGNTGNSKFSSSVSSSSMASLVPDGKNPSSMKPVSIYTPSVRDHSGSTGGANILSVYFPPGEVAVIADAAIRNHCFGENFLILLAIRKAENGRKGFEFGVKPAKGTDLDTQAGWAAATVVKNHNRWLRSDDQGGAGFIEFLADRYVPSSVDPVGNRNFKTNVRYWVDKFQRSGELEEGII